MSGPVRRLAETATPTLLGKIRAMLLAPWTLTGPAASPEFLPSLTYPDKYRKHAPGSSPVQPIVPHSEAKYTFDIKYFPRERRRLNETAINVEPYKHYEIAVNSEKIEGLPPVPGKRGTLQQWYVAGNAIKKVPLLDEENNGYT